MTVLFVSYAHAKGFGWRVVTAAAPAAAEDVMTLTEFLDGEVPGGEASILSWQVLGPESDGSPTDKAMAIVRAVAVLPYPLDDEDGACQFCEGYPEVRTCPESSPGSPADHTPGCPWRMAREVVGAIRAEGEKS